MSWGRRFLLFLKHRCLVTLIYKGGGMFGGCQRVFKSVDKNMDLWVVNLMVPVLTTLRSNRVGITTTSKVSNWRPGACENDSAYFNGARVVTLGRHSCHKVVIMPSFWVISMRTFWLSILKTLTTFWLKTIKTRRAKYTQNPGSSAYTQHWVLYTWDLLIMSISQVVKPLHEFEEDFSRSYLIWTLNLLKLNLGDDH